MPRFTPFRAVRYPTDTKFDDVVAPPYDVLSAEQVRSYQDRDPHNITHLDVPAGPRPYAHAAELYQRWRRDGVLVADDIATLTIYRLRFTDAAGTDRSISGVVGGLEVVDEGAGGVLPHERTTPKASTDRLDLTRATAANLSPVWGLSLARGLTDLLAEPGEPVAAVVDDGGVDGMGESPVEHVIERLTDPDRIAAITASIGTDDVLIADGHHRYGVARSYRDEVRALTGRTDTPAEDTLVFVNELVADQLSVAAIHRLYADVELDALRAALGARFELAPLDAADPSSAPTASTLARMESDGFLTLVTADGSWSLIPKQGAFDDERALDGVWLEAAVADLQHTVSYQHGVEEVVAAVTTGEVTAGVLIRPVSVAEIKRTAREKLLMPPKSTFFTPKLKTGFVMRDLGD